MLITKALVIVLILGRINGASPPRRDRHGGCSSDRRTRQAVVTLDKRQMSPEKLMTESHCVTGFTRLPGYEAGIVSYLLIYWTALCALRFVHCIVHYCALHCVSV